MCRCESPLPGPVGKDLSMFDHLGSSDAGSSYMEQERWFETRYPNLLEQSRLHFTKTINLWVEQNWGQPEYNEASPRIKVHGRNKYEAKVNKDIVWTETYMRDDRFEACGDEPQSFHEADVVLGSFAVDIETPVTIIYSRKNVRGETADAFEWTAVMYIDDTLGVQEHDKPAKIPGVLKWAPSRRVKRAKWVIRGEGFRMPEQLVRTHRVVAGDTLHKLAQKYYGDASKWPIIYKLNADVIGISPGALRVDSVLRVPELSQISPGLIKSAMDNAPPSTAAPNAIPVGPSY